MIFTFSNNSKLINVLQIHIRNAINNKTPENELESFGSASEKSSEKLLYKTTKNLQYIMKFIIRSRILFAKMNDDKDRQLFETSLEGTTNQCGRGRTYLNPFIVRLLSDLLSSFVKLIACPNDMLRSQGALLKYLHIICSDLTQVYDSIKLR